MRTMKRWISLLLALTLLLGLAACGAKTDKADTPKSTDQPQTASGPEKTEAAPTEEPAGAYPRGLFMLRHIGDENGEYLTDGNEFNDFMNQPTTLLKTLYADRTTVWCELGEDGTGSYHDPFHDPRPLDFNTGESGMLKFGEVTVPYRYDASSGVFWFREEEENSRFWEVMEPCSQEKLDLVFQGMGGSVPLAEAKLGDMVCFGQYIQDENQSELAPIWWRVIDAGDGKVLLLCDRLLDSFSYNYNPERAVLTDVTWENCSLRAFLNDESESGFLSLFTGEEIARMLSTRLENKAANAELMAQWGSFQDQGEKKYSDLATQNRADDPETEDRVFLLSYQEVLRYFGEATEAYTEDDDYPFTEMKVNPARIAYVTDAVRGGYYDNATGGGAWMTRTLCSSHSEEDMVVYITGGGQVFDYYTYVPLFIRPAVWVRTEG